MEVNDSHIEEYCKKLNIELHPYQKQILKETLNKNKAYITMPHKVGRTYLLHLCQIANTLLCSNKESED